jgi:hypothetical protein
VLRCPLHSVPLQSINEPFRVSLEEFRESFTGPFLNLHRELLGRLDISTEEMVAFREESSLTALRVFYSRLDAACGSSLARHLDGVRPDATLIVSLAHQSLSQFGGLQLAEAIAWGGEMIWLGWARSAFHDSACQARADARLDQLLSDDAENNKRYRAAMLVAQQLLKDRANLTVLLFAAWMALLTPLDPRTLHLVEEYRLRWADIHPGLRFVRILETLKILDTSVPEDLIVFRNTANVLYDEIAAALGWPPFLRMIEAIARKHPVEDAAPASWSSLFRGLEDPYKKIYDQINLARFKHPWVDIVPGMELLEEVELRVPVILTADRIAIDPDNSDGFLIFCVARIVDLAVFGECDPLLDTLFKDQRRAANLEAICDHLGIGWSAVRDTWKNQRYAAHP